MKISTISFLLVSCFLLALIGISNAADKPPKAPRGFLNTTFLKLAFVAKIIKLVDTEPETPSTVQEHNDIIYKSVDGIDLKLDIYTSIDS